jgi:hypothetical protein
MLIERTEIEQRLQEQAAIAFARILEWDGIDPDSPHYAISPGNPYRVEYDRIVQAANVLGIRIHVRPF